MSYTDMAQCPEIQGQWEPKVGDNCCATERTHNNDVDESCVVQEVSKTQGIISLSLLGLNNKESAAWFYPKENIWLPRLEDLMEMYRGIGGVNDYSILFDLCMYIKETATEEDLKASAKEWLLRLYMFARHDKVWEQEEWIEA